jgi:hypothetical protein
MGIAIMACDDRVSHSLTPTDKTASFDIKTTVADADRILSQVGKRSGNNSTRHPYPEKNAIPHDYIFSIQSRNCMILAEGDNGAGLLRLTVSLSIIRGKTCEDGMVQAFEEAKSMFGYRDSSDLRELR